jgi:hypothetical protein
VIDSITFPVDLAPLYSSVKNVERIDIILDVYDTVGRFFNTFVSSAIISLVSDGSISEYKIGRSDTDDAIVYELLSKSFRKSTKSIQFDRDLLDDLGIGRLELLKLMKLISALLIEITLPICVEELQYTAQEKGLRIDRLIELSVENEFSAPGELPTVMHLVAEFKLDYIKQIEGY